MTRFSPHTNTRLYPWTRAQRPPLRSAFPRKSAKRLTRHTADMIAALDRLAKPCYN